MKFMLIPILTLFSMPLFAEVGSLTEQSSQPEIAKELDRNCDIEVIEEKKEVPMSLLNENVKLVAYNSRPRGQMSALELYTRLAALNSVSSAKQVMDQFGVSAEVAYQVLDNTRAMTASNDPKVVLAGGGYENTAPLLKYPCLSLLLKSFEKWKDIDFSKPVHGEYSAEMPNRKYFDKDLFDQLQPERDIVR